MMALFFRTPTSLIRSSFKIKASLNRLVHVPQMTVDDISKYCSTAAQKFLAGVTQGDRTLPPEEISQIRKNLWQSATVGSFQRISRTLDSKFINSCLELKYFQLGLSYLRFLLNNSDLNLGTMREGSKLLHACYFDQPKDFQPDLAERLSDHLSIKAQENSLLFTSWVQTTCLVGGWKEAIEKTNRRADTLTNTSLTLCHNFIATAAFEVGEESVAWEVLQSISSDSSLLESTVATVLNRCQNLAEKRKRKSMLENFDRLVGLLARKKQFYPPRQTFLPAVRQTFETFNKNSKVGFLVREAAVKNGRCTNCYQDMVPPVVSKEVATKLQKDIMNELVKGKNIYSNTVPRELQSYLDFLQGNKTFDVVLDGLNVFYASCHRGSPRAQGFVKIVVVVERLRELGFKKILVLGRKHMSLNRIKAAGIHPDTQFFFLDSVSTDDPFVLNAALHFAPNCYLATRDKFARELERLQPETAKRLREFLAARQLNMALDMFKYGEDIELNPNGVLMPDKHWTVAQGSMDTQRWHVPMDDGLDRYFYEFPKTWLCVSMGQE